MGHQQPTEIGTGMLVGFPESHPWNLGDGISIPDRERICGSGLGVEQSTRGAQQDRLLEDLNASGYAFQFFKMQMRIAADVLKSRCAKILRAPLEQGLPRQGPSRFREGLGQRPHAGSEPGREDEGVKLLHGFPNRFQTPFPIGVSGGTGWGPCPAWPARGFASPGFSAHLPPEVLAPVFPGSSLPG